MFGSSLYLCVCSVVLVFRSSYLVVLLFWCLARPCIFVFVLLFWCSDHPITCMFVPLYVNVRIIPQSVFVPFFDRPFT